MSSAIGSSVTSSRIDSDSEGRVLYAKTAPEYSGEIESLSDRVKMSEFSTLPGALMTKS